MSDEQLRRLERAARLGDPLSRERYLRDLERRGNVADAQAAIERAIALVQKPVHRGDRQFIEVNDIATAVRDVLARTGWRIVSGQVFSWQESDGPVGTFAVVVATRAEVIIGIDRGDMVAVSDAKARLERARAAPLAFLDLVQRPLLRFGRELADAWSGSYRHRLVPGFDWLLHVRMRPAMYVGSVDSEGATRLVDWVLERQLAAHGEGRCSEVHVTLEDRVLTIDDDGPSLDPSPHPKANIPVLELELTRIAPGHALAVANALSSWLEVESFHEGRVFRQSYERGRPLAAPECRGATKRRGLRVRFELDSTIFVPPATISRDELRRRFQELAHLHPALTLTLDGERFSSSGIADALLEIAPGCEPILASTSVRDDVSVELALAWTSGPERIVGFVNAIALPDGGTHVAAIRRTVDATFERVARVRDRTWLPGLAVVVSMRVAEPAFEGSRRTRLGNPEVVPFVENVTTRALARFFRDHPERAVQVLRRGIRERRPRLYSADLVVRL